MAQALLALAPAAVVATSMPPTSAALSWIHAMTRSKELFLMWPRSGIQNSWVVVGMLRIGTVYNHCELTSTMLGNARQSILFSGLEKLIATSAIVGRPRHQVHVSVLYTTYLELLGHILLHRIS